MAVEADELYCSLNKLLDDICKFLTDKTNYEKLSPQARKQADALINRSKEQLQQIAQVSMGNEEYDGAYVDMEKKSEESKEDEKNNIYSSVEESTMMPPQVVLKPSSNPYGNLPAKNLSQDIKFGSLSWKCKIILKFEKTRRIYAGVHDNWLLVYSTEKDVKPLNTFDLKYHKARAVVTSKSKYLTQDFELVSTVEGKTYYFVALTHKDMLQWITHINRCYDSLNTTDNFSISEESISETYDIIPDLGITDNTEDQEDEESVYHDIEEYAPQQSHRSSIPPDLPARRCIKNVPVPVLPKTTNRGEVNEPLPTYESSRISLDSINSFSEDEEDAIYEPFVSKPTEIKPVFNRFSNTTNASNENMLNKNIRILNTTNNKQKPQTPVKPKILKDKPKNVMLLRK